MNSQEELKDAVKAALENRGVLRDVRARLRAEVFRSLDDSSTERPPLSNANLLVNSLINEYLEFNEYRHTESVLLAESGQSDAACLSRQFLCNELGMQPVGNAKKMPLLYSMVNFFLEKRHTTNATAREYVNQPPVDAADLDDEDDAGESSARYSSDWTRAPRGSSRVEEETGHRESPSTSARRREPTTRRSDEKETRAKRESPRPRTSTDSLSDRRTSLKQEGNAIYIIQD